MAAAAKHPSLLDGGTWEFFSDSIMYPKKPCPVPFATKSRIQDVPGHSRNVNSLGFNASGTILASGSDDRTARLWSAAELSCVAKYDQHADGVVQLCWEPTSDSRFATLSADKHLRFFDSRQRQVANQLKVSHEYINLAWTPDGHYIAVGSSVGPKDDLGVKDSVSVVDARACRVVRKLKFSYEVNEFCWGPNSTHLLLTTEHGTVEVLQAVDHRAATNDGSTVTKKPYTMHAHTDDCYCVDLRGDRLVVGSKDSIVSIWDLDYLACVRTVARHVTPVRCVALSRDATFLASSAYDPGIDIADTQSGDRVHVIEASYAMNALAWHPSSLVLAFAVDAKTPPSAGAPGGTTATSTGAPSSERASPPAASTPDAFLRLFSVPDAAA